MKTARKITVHVPEMLLDEAQKSTGLGITETIRMGLRLVAAKRAYQEVRKLRGKVKFSLNLDSIKKDRGQ